MNVAPVSVPIHLEADDPSATHTPSGWVGLIPISTVESDVLPEAAVKRLHGIRGDVYFIVGSETSLAIRDLLMDVFNQPGDYQRVPPFAITQSCMGARVPSLAFRGHPLRLFVISERRSHLTEKIIGYSEDHSLVLLPGWGSPGSAE